MLDKLLVNMENNCNVDRKKDFNYVKENLEENFKRLIIFILAGAVDKPDGKITIQRYDFNFL